MNLKKAKHIRSYLRERLKVSNPERQAKYETALVPSGRQHYSVTVTTKGPEGPEDVVHKDKALQIKLTRDSPRSMYQRIKGNARVQTTRAS